jgi:hypothetical protein
VVGRIRSGRAGIGLGRFLPALVEGRARLASGALLDQPIEGRGTGGPVRGEAPGDRTEG